MLKANLSPPGRVRVAPSSWASSASLAKAGRKTDSNRAAEALPPAPWARVTTVSASRGFRRRNASMRSKTTASRLGAGSVPITSVMRRSPLPWWRVSPTSAAPPTTAPWARASWASWMRWTLSDGTTRHSSTEPEAAMAPPPGR